MQHWRPLGDSGRYCHLPTILRTTACCSPPSRRELTEAQHSADDNYIQFSAGGDLSELQRQQLMRAPRATASSQSSVETLLTLGSVRSATLRLHYGRQDGEPVSGWGDESPQVTDDWGLVQTVRIHARCQARTSRRHHLHIRPRRQHRRRQNGCDRQRQFRFRYVTRCAIWKTLLLCRRRQA